MPKLYHSFYTKQIRKILSLEKDNSGEFVRANLIELMNIETLYETSYEIWFPIIKDMAKQNYSYDLVYEIF
jgi:hypothetical protein